MATYKFRAECTHDIEELSKLLTLNEISATIISEQDVQFSDCEATIETELSIDETREVMRAVVDGHVMAETLKPENEYDGERVYGA